MSTRAPAQYIAAGGATFAFHSPDQSPYNQVTFVCKAEVLDPPLQTYNYGCSGGTFDWGFTYDGHYRMTIIARDASGNQDPAPPVIEFTADRVPPETSLDSGPSGTLWQRWATFTFSGSDPTGGYSGTVPGSGVGGYECRLDGGSWNPCTSGVGYDQLAQGSHTFDVRAVDRSGNSDPTPASRTWTVSSPQCYGQFATMVGTAGADVLTGTAGPDVIIGLGGNDTINGAGGDDRICGGDGNDSLVGGPGVDRLDGGAGTDTADYKAAPAGVTLNLSLDPGTASGGDGNDPSLISIETVQGSAYADSLTGTDAVETLLGNGGNDVLAGLGGNDILRGGPGADSLNGGAGNDTADYQKAPSAVTVNLSTSPGTASGGDGSDPSLVCVETVQGSAYADSLTGGSAADTLVGNAGNDTLAGLGGNDVLRGGAGSGLVRRRGRQRHRRLPGRSLGSHRQPLRRHGERRGRIRSEARLHRDGAGLSLRRLADRRRSGRHTGRQQRRRRPHRRCRGGQPQGRKRQRHALRPRRDLGPSSTEDPARATARRSTRRSTSSATTRASSRSVRSGNDAASAKWRGRVTPGGGRAVHRTRRSAGRARLTVSA